MPSSEAATGSAATPRQHFAQLWQRLYGQHPVSWHALHAQVQPVPLLAASTPDWRPATDARAAWQRWHGPQLVRTAATLFSASQWPFYAVFERARVEVLASRELPGMASNLQHLQVLQPADSGLSALYALARAVLADDFVATADLQDAGDPAPPGSGWSAWWPGLCLALRRRPAPVPPSPSAIRRHLLAVRPLLEQGEAFAQALQPLVQRLADAAGHDSALRTRRTGGKAERLSEQARATQQRQGTGSAPPRAETPATTAYQVYSSEWDETGPASRWLEPEDRQRLDLLAGVDTRLHRELARRLQRQLQAFFQPVWLFEQEAGQLDSRRLARLASPAPVPRVFRQRETQRATHAAVTFLVDASGSMRGQRMQMAAAAVDFAVQALERCGVMCEVLAYTTRFGEHNPLRERWQAEGEPAAPGRLNALRHIVLKSASQPWQRMRPGLGLLLREGFGQDNIDGEALHWAATRLARLPAVQNKVLLVIADGLPYDEATVAANGRHYLDMHLRQVIARIEASPLRLAAVGIAHDVGRFYGNALSLYRVEEIAPVLFERLQELLTHPRALTQVGART